MNLKTLIKIFSNKACNKIYVKNLAANDNSKNQVYFGGSFDILNIIPAGEITTDIDGKRIRESFKAKLDFYWINENGDAIRTNHSQLILYPDYPEIRFSGFLLGCKEAPSELMRSRIVNRVLFLGVGEDGKTYGFVTGPDSEIANEFASLKSLPNVGVFKEISIERGRIELNSKGKLLAELKRIHSLGWIDSKRFDSTGNILPCISSNCGGYTLEAELGITPNGFSEPDYLGWEVKQFSVKDFKKYNSAIITLMTPEPTHGFYVDHGVESFIRKYGYNDKLGREARLNFGGVHKYGKITHSTNLRMMVVGFDSESRKITDTHGYIGLHDARENIASSWSFVSLIEHWKKKHSNACYVPSMNRKDEKLFPFSKQQYSYGNNIILGSSTDFTLFLDQIVKGNIYYDPGIKLELEIPEKRKQNIKRRSQFRIKSGNLSNLYNNNEIVNLEENFKLC